MDGVLSIAFLLFMLIVLPAVFIFVLWRAAFKSKLEWGLEAGSSILLVVWLFQSANWSWIGIWARYIWMVLLAVALFISWIKIRTLPLKVKYTGNQKFSIAIHGFLILVFGYYNVMTITSYSTKEDGVDLVFPIQEGAYYVGHGGNHRMMNYHQDYPPQKYALDILGLNGLGTRAKGLLPTNLDQYAIYGDRLVSPCNGTVVETQDGLIDMTPPEMDSDQPEGNHVSLICEQHPATVLLAHMQQGSVAVKEGDIVKTGQYLGKVGNSGNTSEPHLHIHAEMEGVGVPIRFDGRFLVRNNVIKAGK
ncbi:M23 family metallopeptidase [Sporosarcina sp. Te-1]|uniref:M23 family metallopeptidase n=1 Tax=Sporosarcina sp. Te-1 TaxID=2818390 RepID=UPI001A9D0ECC|nr:M23 family metallopeptidase [Sporosarcina sp. Te-1]QTD43169.1 M23 family metallopeptidase [Sporosarcina sp. Te-1]